MLSNNIILNTNNNNNNNFNISSELVVKIIPNMDNVKIFELLHLQNFFNSIKSNKICKLEYFSLQEVEKFNSDLLLVSKRKKWDLDQAMRKNLINFKLQDKIFIAE